MTLTTEVKSDGYGGWQLVPRSYQIWELISKAIDKRIDCRLEWARWYRINTNNLNKTNRQKVYDIKKFLVKSEYAYLKRSARLLEELNGKQMEE